MNEDKGSLGGGPGPPPRIPICFLSRTETQESTGRVHTPVLRRSARLASQTPAAEDGGPSSRSGRTASRSSEVSLTRSSDAVHSDDSREPLLSNAGMMLPRQRSDGADGFEGPLSSNARMSSPPWYSDGVDGFGEPLLSNAGMNPPQQRSDGRQASVDDDLVMSGGFGEPLSSNAGMNPPQQRSDGRQASVDDDLVMSGGFGEPLSSNAGTSLAEPPAETLVEETGDPDRSGISAESSKEASRGGKTNGTKKRVRFAEMEVEEDNDLATRPPRRRRRRRRRRRNAAEESSGSPAPPQVPRGPRISHATAPQVPREPRIFNAMAPGMPSYAPAAFPQPGMPMLPYDPHAQLAAPANSLLPPPDACTYIGGMLVQSLSNSIGQVFADWLQWSQQFAPALAMMQGGLAPAGGRPPPSHGGVAHTQPRGASTAQRGRGVPPTPTARRGRRGPRAPRGRGGS